MSERLDEEVSHATDVSLFTSDESDEWATPLEFLRPLASAVDGFDLDAASGAETSPIADHAYTEEDDGLVQPWYGTVWCNPPYSEMAAWTDKVVCELQRDGVDAILYLCKGDTSTGWWHQALAEATVVGMLDARLSFGDGSESAPFASHVFAFGDVPSDVLERQGAVFDAGDQHERTEQRKLVTDGGTDDGGVDRVPPLNMNEEEAKYLWEMVKEEVGKEEVQYSDDRSTVEALHTKIGNIAPGVDFHE